VSELPGPDPAGIRPQPSVVLYSADGCHLCEKARAVLEQSGVRFEEVDITGDPELEAAYREWLPVVELDGERAFVYFVDPAALRRKIAAQS
jgi:glutaredoxin